MAGFTPLTRAIQELGMSPQKFALEKLDLKYTTFSYRVRVGHLYLDDYHRIIYFTGKTFEELFPNPYRLTPRFPESITISKRPKPANDHPRPETPPVQEQKKEADFVSASAPDDFEPVDIGIPPIDSPGY